MTSRTINSDWYAVGKDKEVREGNAARRCLLFMVVDALAAVPGAGEPAQPVLGEDIPDITHYATPSDKTALELAGNIISANQATWDQILLDETNPCLSLVALFILALGFVWIRTSEMERYKTAAAAKLNLCCGIYTSHDDNKWLDAVGVDLEYFHLSSSVRGDPVSRVANTFRRLQISNQWPRMLREAKEEFQQSGQGSFNLHTVGPPAAFAPCLRWLYHLPPP